LPVHAAQQRDALGAALGRVAGDEGLDRAAETQPARQRDARLAPGESPGDGAQVLDRARGAA